MKYYSKYITFIEHPQYISLSYGISGCRLNCINCHSKSLEDLDYDDVLTADKLINDLNTYKDYIENVVFLGGEWEEDSLIDLLKICKEYNLKTTLYTGLEDVSDTLKLQLDYLKIGPYIERLGGLESINTNQKMIRLSDNLDITHLFVKEE